MQVKSMGAGVEWPDILEVLQWYYLLLLTFNIF